MFRTSLLTVLAIALLASLSTGVTWAANYNVNYFENANTTGYPDGSVRLINPNTSGVTVCADIYVFHPDQEMAECCSCTVTPDGLTSLSVNTDLTSNALTGGSLTGGGVIKIVATATPCNDAKLAPSGTVDAWGTHVLTLSTGGFQVTETAFTVSTLSSAEETALDTDCAAIQQDGSGHGICTCGVTG
jgi:hypothetical protein